MRPNDDLKRLAREIWSGQIFTDRHFRSSADRERLMGMVFMPLLLMDDAQSAELKAREPAVFFAPLSEALERAINGYPIFMTVSMFTQREWDIVTTYIDGFEAAFSAVSVMPVTQ